MTCPLNGRLWTLLTVAVYHLLLHYPLVTNDQVSIIENAPAGAIIALEWENIGTHTGTKKRRKDSGTKNKKMKAKNFQAPKKQRSRTIRRRWLPALIHPLALFEIFAPEEECKKILHS